ncbi:MAG TPA: glutamate racemase [Saprospiraceae bacterium]|nr:glutamate racemase [Saprospiraceae bacterium]
MNSPGMLTSPIGVFDSGIGGLTVAQAIHNALPREEIVYIGDTAHMPYGDKSPELIRHYAHDISQCLIKQFHCKALVIACNTASASAYELLRDSFKGILPVINVIDPMVEYVISRNDLHHVGIIATKATVSSGVYQEKISRRKKELNYSVLSTPLLAPMIEEGFYNNSISHAILHEYLSNEVLQGIDGLILACTHYPLIKPEISSFFDHKIPIIDSAEVVAAKLKHILEKEKLLNTAEGFPNHQFYITDYSDHFVRTAKLFYGEQINLQRLNLSNE